MSASLKLSRAVVVVKVCWQGEGALLRKNPLR